ncbi:restriction endonuclease subunit S [Priestia aryabhattai]|uniref:restriction endonuclease subunit S n=1 Tax=Priestia aryabhattai TaxID=412384 RepID=UPI003D276E22
MLHLKFDDVKVEEYLVELGYTYVEKHVKAGPFLIDMVGYSIRKGELKPSVVVEMKTNDRDVVQIQNKLSRYVHYLESSCDALIVTNEGMVWLDVKSGLPKEKPSKRRSKTFIENQTDIFKLLKDIYTTLSNELSSEQKIELIEKALLIRAYLFEESNSKKNFFENWDRLFRQESGMNLLKLALEKYKLVNKFTSNIEIEELSVIKNQLSFIHPQTPSLGVAFIEFQKEVSKPYYPSFIKELIEGILESLSNKNAEKESYLFWDYATLFISPKPIKNRVITTINTKENERVFLFYLAAISGYYHFYHFLNPGRRKHDKKRYKYCVLDTVSRSYPNKEVSKMIKEVEIYLESEGYLLLLLTDSYVQEEKVYLPNVENSKFKIRAIIGLPEHTYRPLSRRMCKLFILQKSKTVSKTYFKKDIQSLEKDISKTIKLFGKWIDKKEERHVYKYEVGNLDFIHTEKMGFTSNRYKSLEELASINPESIKINLELSYKYLDIQSIDKHGIITTCKILKGRELPKRSRYRVRKGDIILSLLRPGGEKNYNYIGYVTDQYDGALTNINLCVVRPEKINSKLLYLYFRNRYFSNRLSSLCIGNIPRLNISLIKKLPISNQVLGKLEGNPQTLFEEIMLVFESSHEKKIDRLFNSLFAQTLFKRYYLGHVADIQLGTKGSFQETYQYQEIHSEELENFTPYVRSKNLTIEDVFIEKENVEWVKFDHKVPERLLAKKGDILVDKTAGLLKKSILVKEEIYNIKEFVSNQHIYKIRLKERNVVDPSYVLTYLKSSYAQLQLIGGRRRLSMKDLRNLIIPVPPREVQLEFRSELENNHRKKKELEQRIEEFSKKIFRK